MAKFNKKSKNRKYNSILPSQSPHVPQTRRSGQKQVATQIPTPSAHPLPWSTPWLCLDIPRRYFESSAKFPELSPLSRWFLPIHLWTAREDRGNRGTAQSKKGERHLHVQYMEKSFNIRVFLSCYLTMLMTRLQISLSNTTILGAER